MGSLNDAVKKLEETQDKTANEIKGALQMLSILAESKKKELMREVDERMVKARQDPEHSNNQVPPGVMLYEYGETRVSTGQGPAEGITSAINGILMNPTDEWRKSIASMAGVALNTLLGAGSGASANTSLYALALDGSEGSQVVVRIDYCLWTYNFLSTGVKDVAQSAVAYFARKSLIDYSLISSAVAIEEVLMVTGLKAEMREALKKKIAEEKAAKGKTAELMKYARELPTELASVVHKHYESLDDERIA